MRGGPTSPSAPAFLPAFFLHVSEIRKFGITKIYACRTVANPQGIAIYRLTRYRYFPCVLSAHAFCNLRYFIQTIATTIHNTPHSPYSNTRTAQPICMIHVSMESAMFNDHHGTPTAFLTNFTKTVKTYRNTHSMSLSETKQLLIWLLWKIVIITGKWISRSIFLEKHVRLQAHIVNSIHCTGRPSAVYCMYTCIAYKWYMCMRATQI